MIDLFSWAAGAARRDAGMVVVAAAQEREAPGWADRAYAAIVAVARAQDTVHIDDVRLIFAENARDNRAWGPVWRRAIKDRVIVATGTVRETTDPRKHLHPSPVYRSLIRGRSQ